MTIFASPQQLEQLRQKLRQERQVAPPPKTQIVLTMSSPSLAAGAGQVYQALRDQIKREGLENQVVIKQSGLNGFDSYEPILVVIQGDQPPVYYGRVTPQLAGRILREHVQQGKILEENRLPIT